MNWISRLERKYGRFCIPNLISLIVGGQILVYAIELFVNQFVSSYLGLSRRRRRARRAGMKAACLPRFHI